MQKKKQNKTEKNLEILNPNSAGIDIGSGIHYVAVPEQKDSNPIRHFGANTKDLEEITNWLL